MNCRPFFLVRPLFIPNTVISILSGTVLAVASSGATAQSTYAEQSKQIRAPAAVVRIGIDLFGDKVNLYNGMLEFSQTDVSLPGNNALPVALGRRVVTGSGVPYRSDRPFGRWDLDIPHLHGMFSSREGWTSEPSATKRCTEFGVPRSTPGMSRLSTWDASEFWNGNFLYMPGGGDQQMLTRSSTNSIAPGPVADYPVVTRDFWSISCLPSLANGSTLNNRLGEGFLAVAPDGTRYRFDWMVTYAASTLRKSEPTASQAQSLNAPGEPQEAAPPNGNDKDGDLTPQAPDVAMLARMEVWLLPTLITDRFGNTVTYTYDPLIPANLKKIESSDGRSLSITYVAGTGGDSNQIKSVSDGTRTWLYSYHVFDGQTNLDQVTLPDNSSWSFAGTDELLRAPSFKPPPGCNDPVSAGTTVLNGTMVHPSGATGSFSLTPTLHGRSNVKEDCRLSIEDGSLVDIAAVPRYFATLSLSDKTISGPGLGAMTWKYGYGPANASWAPCGAACVSHKTVSVIDPDNNETRYTFGNRHFETEGQLQQLDVIDNGVIVRSTSMHYRAPGENPYPDFAGYAEPNIGDGDQLSRLMPLEQRVTIQQGVTFTWQANSFDQFARATNVTRWSTLGASRSETTAYADNLPKWVLGQVKQLSEDSTGKVMVLNGYNATTANLETVTRFGKLEKTMTYHADGTLATQKDGLNQTTTFSDYRCGLARTIRYQNGSSESAVVNNIGTIDAATDAAGYTTTYGYDAMGRLSSITPPADDTVKWNPTTIAFSQEPAPEFGLAAGHWRREEKTGNEYTKTYYDALWREIYTERFDNADASATRRITKRQYDHAGRTTYESYPKRKQEELSEGKYYEYDALGRPTVTGADTELGLVYSGFSYQSGFQKTYTDARQHNTTYSYQAFDVPDESAITSIVAPEGVSVAIARDLFGKPQTITRSGNGKSATRSYVYDPYERLCKTIEPETGATVQDYDAANNVAWRASGLSLLSASDCGTASVLAAKKTGFYYDGLNRLTTTTYGDGSAAIFRTYTANGLPETIRSGAATWTYTYNKRRLIELERLDYGRAYIIARRYDGNGSLRQLQYPVDYLTLSLNPNALGEPRQIGAYASLITYHPNGALATFKYGNGITHTLTQNRRGLPEQSTDDHGVLNDRYTYDANANVAGIADLMPPNVTNRTMGYDGLDRLKTVSAPNLWGNASYEYDALDNLTSTTITGGGTARNSIHSYDASKNRLDSITGGPAQYNFAYGYDTQGNIIKRGAQEYVFDLGNRMKSATGKGSYVYDGLGRRVSAVGVDGVNRVQVYSQDGKLMYAGPTGSTGTKYIYLHNHLIAEVGGAGTQYDHTDGLGSPVAITNAARGIVSRTRYEPYGATAQGATPAIGFAGHVSAPDLGLVYMQQRYYDPIAGRMLSIDPVTTDANTGGSFNRYAYANNSPYKYIDPDGREPIFPLLTQERADKAAQYLADKQISTGNSLYAIPGVIAAVYAAHGEALVLAIGSVKGGPKGSMGGPRAGMNHTQAAKRIALQDNKLANGGKAICPTCKAEMTDPKQSKSGEPKDMKQAEGDHIVPKSNGGDGATVKDMANIETKCAQCNNNKSDQ